MFSLQLSCAEPQFLGICFDVFVLQMRCCKINLWNSVLKECGFFHLFFMLRAYCRTSVLQTVRSFLISCLNLLIVSSCALAVFPALSFILNNLHLLSSCSFSRQQAYSLSSFVQLAFFPKIVGGIQGVGSAFMCSLTGIQNCTPYHGLLITCMIVFHVSLCFAEMFTWCVSFCVHICLFVAALPW